MRSKIFIIMLFISTMVSAQITTGGAPLPYNRDCTQLRNSNNIFYQLNIDTTEALPDATTSKILYTGYTTELSLNPQNSGTSFIAENGDLVWRVGVCSPGAGAISLILSKFNIPDDASIYVYNPSQTIVKGAYTNINNNNSGILPIQPVFSDSVIIEYHEPNTDTFNGVIEVGSATHNLSSRLKITNKLYSAVSMCSPLACLNSDIEPYNRATVLMYVVGKSKSWFGTGQLINNPDKKPYIYTAGHCISESATPAGDYATQTIYYFNYEVPAVDTLIQPSTEFSIAGGTTLAAEFGLDMALIELSQMPPKDYRPYMLGWDLTSTPQATTTCIQHPNGDVKRVSRDYDAPIISTYDGSLNGTKITNSFWKISRWDVGCTEGGSSGSALLDANYHIIGALTGGQSICKKPLNDYYSRISYAYDYYPEPNRQLKHWLNPYNAGISQMEGADPYEDINPCERYKNFDDDATISKCTNCGHNEDKDTELAEHFHFDEDMTIWGAIIVPYKGNNNQVQPIYLNIYEGGETKPGKLLSKTVIHPIDKIYNRSAAEWRESDKKVLADKETYVRLAEPVRVNTDCYISCQFSYYAVTDSFALYATNDVEESNTYVKGADNHWYKFDNLSLWIEPIASIYDPTAINESGKNSKGIITYPNPTSDGIVWIEGEESRFQVYNSQGFLIKSGYGNKVILPTEKGLYLLHITQNKTSETHKIIRQ